MDDKIITVNEAIISGANPYVKIKEPKDGSKTWTLPYTKKPLGLTNKHQSFDTKSANHSPLA